MVFSGYDDYSVSYSCPECGALARVMLASGNIEWVPDEKKPPGGKPGGSG